ncbi:MAG: hypothetical protein ACKOGG_07540, partial [Actinomycetota bacterium]
RVQKIDPNAVAHQGICAVSGQSMQGTQLAKMPYFFLDRYIPSYIAEWNEFIAVANGKIAPVVTGADGRASLVAGLAAWKSVREGRLVKTSEIA